MRLDFIILEKRVKGVASRFFHELDHSSDLNYATFFPELEKRLQGLFSEQGLLLSYKGRTGRVFPTTLFWGQETDYGDGTFSRRGEIEIMHYKQKVGSLLLEFKMKRGSVKIIEEPSLTLKAL